MKRPMNAWRIEVNDLCDIGQSGVSGLVKGMVEAGPAVQKEQRWPLAHHRALRHKLCALDIEEQAHAVDQNMHDNSPSLVSMKVLR